MVVLLRMVWVGVYVQGTPTSRVTIVMVSTAGNMDILYVPYDTVFMVHTTLRTLITVDILTVSMPVSLTAQW